MNHYINKIPMANIYLQLPPIIMPDLLSAAPGSHYHQLVLLFSKARNINHRDACSNLSINHTVTTT